jgi:SAM-dependent methyltransferase
MRSADFRRRGRRGSTRAPRADGPVLGPVLGTETADVESSSDDYARRFSGAVGRHFLAVQERLTLELLAPWPGARVLDVGGGHAQLAVPLASHGFAVTVVGSSEVCRTRLDRLLPAGSFQFQACDLLALPFPDRSFDVVLCFRLLSHAHQHRRLLAEICRVARAAVIVDYPDLRSFNLLYGSLFQVKRAAEGNTRTFRCYRPDEVRTELARHGFGEAVVRRQFFLPMVVHRMLGQRWFTRATEGASAALGLTAALGSPVILRAARPAGERQA